MSFRPLSHETRVCLSAAMRWSFLLTVWVWLGCKGAPDSAPWCSAEPRPTGDAGTPAATWYARVEPLVRQKCLGCHEPGGLAGVPLDTYDAFGRAAPSVRSAVLSGRMPPFFAAHCCTSYFDERSLTPDEIETLRTFIDNGLPAGNPSDAPPKPQPVPLLSRVDVTLKLPAPYRPVARAGTTDDLRCFAIDWPVSTSGFITGLSPRVDNRQLVHHLVISALDGDAAKEAKALDAADPLPGFDCNGGIGRFKGAIPIGGSLIGGPLPRGLGTEVKPGSVLLLNMHYSLARTDGQGTDATQVDLMVEPTARKASSIVLSNAAWLVGDAMKVRAGDADATFFYKFRPVLFTGGKRVQLEGVTPHLHAFGKKVAVRVLHKNGTQQCLLEIPRWEFGWEQPYWFEKPLLLEPEDEVYLECHFDNSAANQPNGRAPRDFSWGGDDQDMCAAFIAFTAVE